MSASRLSDILIRMCRKKGNMRKRIFTFLFLLLWIPLSCFAEVELDYMEYPADGNAKQAYVSDSSDMILGWEEIQPAGAANKTWRGVAVDYDGSNIIATVYGGRVYTSADYGANWTERQPAGDTDKNWITCASDSKNGQREQKNN